MKIIFFLVAICFSLHTQAQVDFDNYTSIKAVGTPPKDFSTETYKKVRDALYDESSSSVGNQANQYEFLTQSRYSIDDLLHSGTVTYGDLISNYIEKVAHKLIGNEPELLNEPRFYTIKSNNPNAFSTDQGIIFVTTGLLSRIENEAQLAFILAHEISHYTEHHVAKSFNWQKSKDYDDSWIRDMSIYSKRNELDADKLAIQLYLKAGYSKSGLDSVFDMLAISHLPFANKEINIDYFSTDEMFLPTQLFSDSLYQILPRTSEEDSLSSHPNSETRQIELENEILNILDNWGDEMNFFGENAFKEIRNCARFESVRDYLIDADYSSALYAIYTLESEFEQSSFLKRMKAQSWLGLYQQSKKSKADRKGSDYHVYEGPSAKVHDMFMNLDRYESATLALRHLYNLHRDNSQDKEIMAVYTSLINSLGKDKKFKFEDYSALTFGSALDSISAVTDSLSVDLDSMEYYLYGLSDIVRDTVFINALDKAKKSSTKKNLNFSSIISVEPKTISYTKNGIDLVRSEMMEEKVSKGLRNAATHSGIEVSQVNSRTISSDNGETFNQRSILYSWLTQLGNNEEVPFPVDFRELALLKSEYNTSNVMFSIAVHTYQPDIKWIYLAMSAWLAPTLPIFAPIYIPLKLLSANHTALLIFILDSDTGEVLLNNDYIYNEAISQHSLGARMYEVFMELNSDQNN